MTVARLHAAQSELWLVQCQDDVLPHVRHHAGLRRRLIRLARGAAALRVPVRVLEFQRSAWGPTDQSLLDALPLDADVQDCPRLSGCSRPGWLERLRGRAVVLAGLEAHAGVMLTALDLVEEGCTTAAVVDAVGSRRSLDRDVALRRMEQAGVVAVTVESLLVEWSAAADVATQRRVRTILSSDPGDGVG